MGKWPGRDHSACENGNSSRSTGTKRSASSDLVWTSKMRQRFGSTMDFYSRSGQQATRPLAYGGLQSLKQDKLLA